MLVVCYYTIDGRAVDQASWCAGYCNVSKQREGEADRSAAEHMYRVN
jgi:hypothetical protein